MCNANSFNSGFFGKVNSKIDPLGARLATGDKSKMDPLGLKRSNTPAAPATGSMAAGGATALTGPMESPNVTRPRNGTYLGA